MISTKWKAVEAMVIVLALSVVFLACQNVPASPPTEAPAPPSSTYSPEPSATSAPAPSPEPTQDQSTWTNPRDGAVYVRVPAGPFLMGSTDDDPFAVDDEKPQHPVTLDEFWIKRTEVTNAEYAKCVEVGACTEPHTAIWDDSEYGNHPVDDVAWYQANDYADWAGGRLCTEAEWEKACRGTDGRIYPWGNIFDASKCNSEESGTDDTTPVGKYSPAGDSPYGVADMAGNAWEWTSSLYEDYPYDPTDGREDPKANERRVLRGGAFYIAKYFVRCAYHRSRNPYFRHDDLGFRVCASP